MNPFSRDHASTYGPHTTWRTQIPAPSAAPTVQSVKECMPVYSRPYTMEKT